MYGLLSRIEFKAVVITLSSSRLEMYLGFLGLLVRWFTATSSFYTCIYIYKRVTIYRKSLLWLEISFQAKYVSVFQKSLFIVAIAIAKFSGEGVFASIQQMHSCFKLYLLLIIVTLYNNNLHWMYAFTITIT